MLAIALAATFASIALLGAVAASSIAQRQAVYRSLRTMRESELAATDIRRRELAAPVMVRVIQPALRRFGQRIRRFTPLGVIDRLDETLVYAGSPAGWDGERLLAIKVAATAPSALIGFVLPGVLGMGPLRGVILGPLVGVIGYYLPEWIVRSRAETRQHRIQRALPDALDLLSITVEAGLAFDAALERVAREMGGPLGEELI